METSKQIQYRAYLATDHWKNKRLEVLNLRGCKCEKCGEWGNEIHHLSYKNLWNEPLTDLQVLCRKCHGVTHEILNCLNPRERRAKKKKISRQLISKNLTSKQKKLIENKFGMADTNFDLLDAYILYSNDKKHSNMINFAARLLGFDGYFPKTIKQVEKQSKRKQNYWRK
jgi:hypothetical protein